MVVEIINGTFQPHQFVGDDSKPLSVFVGIKLVYTNQDLTYKEILDLLIGKFKSKGVTYSIIGDEKNKAIAFVYKGEVVEYLTGPLNDKPIMGTVEYYQILYNYLVKQFSL